MHWIESQATSGGGSQKSNRITLLRDADGDGVPETRNVFLDNLSSPFGVALAGSDLYVANTDAIVRYPYNAGDTKISAAGLILTQLPGGPIDHHWTKSLLASGRFAAVRRSRLEQLHHRKGHEENRTAIWEVDRASGRWRIFASGLRNPNGLSWEPQMGFLCP
jgi:glucose/arabinose dehydrogenase